MTNTTETKTFNIGDSVECISMNVSINSGIIIDIREDDTALVLDVDGYKGVYALAHLNPITF